MAIKTTGAEFKAWLAADWGHPDATWDDYELDIDGKVHLEYDDAKIADDATVTIKSGTITIPAPTTGRRRKDQTLDAVAHFKTWREQQGLAICVARIPKDRLVEVHNFIKSVGGTYKP